MVIILNNKDFGQRIKKYRNIKGLTSECCAELVGISHDHFRRIENGYNLPSIQVLLSISNVLDVAPHMLLSDDTQTLNSPIDIQPTDMKGLTLDQSRMFLKILETVIIQYNENIIED